MSRQTALITIEKISLNASFLKTGPGSMGMEFKLLNPRPNISLRKRVMVFQVDDAGRLQLPLTLAERIVFKESIDGHLGLRVESTGLEDTDVFSEFLRKVASIALKASGDVIATQWSEPMKSIARAPFRFLADEIEDDKTGPELVAAHTIDYNPEEGSKEIMLSLKALKNIYAPQTQIRKRGPRKTKQKSTSPKRVVAEGEPIGEIVLRMSIS